MKKIICLVLGFILLLAETSLLSGCGNKEKEKEEAFKAEFVAVLEQEIEEFKQENPEDTLKHEITFDEIDDDGASVRVVYHIETSQEPYAIINGNKFYSYNYYPLFPYKFLESIATCVDTYGEVYVNGELDYTEKKETSSSSSSSGSNRCGVCDKSYSDSENVKSIKRTNMCTRCYKNYKYATGN